MKKIIFKTFLSITILLCVNCSSSDDSRPINPEEDIIGKWRVIEDTYGPVNNTSGAYEEFLQDNVLLIYNSKNDFSYDKYLIKDSILYKGHIYIDNITNDTIFVDALPFKFIFLDYNTLKTTMLYPALNPIQVYKRIN